MNASADQHRNCAYCGLPVPAPLWSGDRSRSDAEEYCCFGCRFAHAVTKESGEEGSARWTMTRLGISIFFAMNVMVFTLALWAYNAEGIQDSHRMVGPLADLFRWLCLLLSLPVLVLLGKPLIENALAQLGRGVLSTDVLLVSGVLAAYAYSIAAVWRSEGEIYFEVGVMILVLTTLGRWLEATGKLRSTRALDQLQQLLPPEVTRVEADGTRTRILSGEIRVGDRLRVLPGERIPADGLLRSAGTTVDEQLMTGESWPVEKVEGDPLIGGTLNMSHDLVFEVHATPDSGTLARLIEAVRESRNRRGNYQLLADRVTQRFVPAVVIIALVVLIVHGRMFGTMQGILASLSVLLIACPCALGLATPMAIWAAIGTAARQGIVFRNGDALERLSSIRAIRFDKTGTLTTGIPRIGRVVRDPETPEEEFRRRAFLLAESSNHLLSREIARWSPVDPASVPTVQVHTVPGRGVYAMLPMERRPTALGNLYLMSDLDVEPPLHFLGELTEVEGSGKPFVLVGWGGWIRGAFVFEEELRPESLDVCDLLRRRGIDLGILTGDNERSADRLARSLGVPVLAELTPERKQKELRNVRSAVGPVAFVGDGINDAPSMGVADVGLALGCGADVTRDAADICILSNDLRQIPKLLDLSRETVSTIRRNLVWSFSYNVVGIVLASLGWLHPAVAALFMVLSSLFVIGNSLRLAREPATPGVRSSEPRHEVAV